MSRRFLIPICLLLILSSALGQATDNTTATAPPTTDNTTTGAPTTTDNTTTTTDNTTTTTPPAGTGSTTTAPPATTNVTTTNVTNATTTTTPTTPTITVNSSQNGETVVTTTPANGSAPTTSTITFATLQNIEKAGAKISSYPTQSYTLYLVDIHFVSGNLSAQYIAHHYCHFISEDMMQCALYNDSTSNARFIGNEYFITKALFDTLDTQERHLWHSHPFEVQSGLFVAPDLDPTDEFTLMEWLMGTFGKVTDTWQFFETFPMGPPQLGMALALDSQVNWTVADLMDKQLNLKTTYQQRQQDRAELVAPPPSRAADSYLYTGNATQYKVYEFAIPNNGKNLTTGNAGTTTTTTPAGTTGNATTTTPPAGTTGNATTTTPPAGNATTTTTPAGTTGNATTTTPPAGTTGNATTTTPPAGNATTTTTPATGTTTTPAEGTNATTTTTTTTATPPANATTTPVSTA